MSRGKKIISILTAVLVAFVTVCGAAAPAFAETEQAVWGQNGLNDRNLGKYLGRPYDQNLPGEKYNHCVGYVHWALTHYYGDQFEDMPDCLYVRIMRDWVIRHRSSRKIRFVGGATISVRSGEILRSDGLDWKPGDIVFFHTATDIDAKTKMSSQKILRQVALSQRTGWPGTKAYSKTWTDYYWQHVAVIGGDGKTMFESTNGRNNGLIHRRTPDGLLKLSRKRYLKHRKSRWGRIQWRKQNFTYQIWRPTKETPPSIASSTVRADTAAETGGADAAA